MVNLRNRAEDEALEQDNDELEIEGDSLASVENELRQRRRQRRGEGFTPGDAAKQKNAGSSAPQVQNRAASAPRPNIFQRIPVVRPIYNYLAESMEEMQKVTWPSREETYRLTRLVIAFTIFSSIGLGLFDVFYGWWFRQALDNETIFLGFGAIVSVALLVFTYYFFVKADEISHF